VCFEQKLELQKKTADEQKKQLLPQLKDKITKVESIRSALNGNRVHATLEELNQKLFNQQQAVIRLHKGKFLYSLAHVNKRLLFILHMCCCCGVTQDANLFKEASGAFEVKNLEVVVLPPTEKFLNILKVNLGELKNDERHTLCIYVKRAH
jgi:hypothetical protein